MEYWDIRILRYWNIDILRYWNLEILRHWDIEILGYWDTGILLYWNIKILEFRYIGIQKYYNSEMLEFAERTPKNKILSFAVLDLAKYTIIILILIDLVPIFFIFHLFEEYLGVIPLPILTSYTINNFTICWIRKYCNFLKFLRTLILHKKLRIMAARMIKIDNLVTTQVQIILFLSAAIQIPQDSVWSWFVIFGIVKKKGI